MIIVHLFCSLVLVQQATSFFGSKILRTMATDELAPSRFLMMDDPMFKLYHSDSEEIKSDKQMSLSDVSTVIDSVLQTKDVKIASETKDISNLEYEIAVKGNRKLNLLANMQDGSVQLKLSSFKENFDKEVQVSTDSQESKKDIQNFLNGSFDDFKSQTEGRSLAQLTINDNSSLVAFLKKSQELTRDFEFSIQSKDSNSSRISVKAKSANELEEFAEIAIVNQVSISDGQSKPEESTAQKFVKVWFNLKENEKIEDHYRHAVFAHSINLSDDDSIVGKFVAEKLSEIKNLLNEKSPEKVFVSFEEAAKKFIKLLESFTVPKTGKKAFINIEDDHIRDIVNNSQIKSNSHIIRGTFNGSPSYDVQIVIFKIEERQEMGIHIAALDREYEAKVPLFDFEARFDAIKPIITEFLLPDLALTPFNSLQSAVDKINQIIKDICGKKPFLEIELMKLNYGQPLQVYSNPKIDSEMASLSDSYKQSCPFNFAQIRLMQYSFGYFHFIHLNIDNEYLHSEYLLSPHSESFNDNVTEIFQELFAELNQIKEDHKNNLVGQQLSFSQIKHIFEKIMKKKESSESLDVAEFFNDDQSMEVRIKKLATGFFRISFIQNPWNKATEGADKINIIKEIYIPENNGLNQLERMRAQILKFLKQDISEHIEKTKPAENKEADVQVEAKETVKKIEKTQEKEKKESVVSNPKTVQTKPSKPQSTIETKSQEDKKNNIQIEEDKPDMTSNQIEEIDSGLTSNQVEDIEKNSNQEEPIKLNDNSTKTNDEISNSPPKQEQSINDGLQKLESQDTLEEKNDEVEKVQNRSNDQSLKDSDNSQIEGSKNDSLEVDNPNELTIDKGPNELEGSNNVIAEEENNDTITPSKDPSNLENSLETKEIKENNSNDEIDSTQPPQQNKPGELEPEKLDKDTNALDVSTEIDDGKGNKKLPEKDDKIEENQNPAVPTDDINEEEVDTLSQPTETVGQEKREKDDEPIENGGLEESTLGGNQQPPKAVRTEEEIMNTSDTNEDKKTQEINNILPMPEEENQGQSTQSLTDSTVNGNIPPADKEMLEKNTGSQQPQVDNSSLENKVNNPGEKDIDAEKNGIEGSSTTLPVNEAEKKIDDNEIAENINPIENLNDNQNLPPGEAQKGSPTKSVTDNEENLDQSENKLTSSDNSLDESDVNSTEKNIKNDLGFEEDLAKKNGIESSEINSNDIEHEPQGETKPLQNSLDDLDESKQDLTNQNNLIPENLEKSSLALDQSQQKIDVPPEKEKGSIVTEKDDQLELSGSEQKGIDESKNQPPVSEQNNSLIPTSFIDDDDDSPEGKKNKNLEEPKSQPSNKMALLKRRRLLM